MNTNKFLLPLTLLGLCLSSSGLLAAEVNITPEVESVTVKHGENDVSIMRNQNQKNMANPAFAKTSVRRVDMEIES